MNHTDRAVSFDEWQVRCRTLWHDYLQQFVLRIKRHVRELGDGGSTTVNVMDLAALWCPQKLGDRTLGEEAGSLAHSLPSVATPEAFLERYSIPFLEKDEQQWMAELAVGVWREEMWEISRNLQDTAQAAHRSSCALFSPLLCICDEAGKASVNPENAETFRPLLQAAGKDADALLEELNAIPQEMWVV